MTHEELVDLGKLLTAVSELQDIVTELHTQLRGMRSTIGSLQATVSNQTSQIMELSRSNQYLGVQVMRLRGQVGRLSGEEEADTDPDCPALLSDAPPSHRAKLRSVSDDEPDSALTRQMEFRASKSGFETKGPSIMVVALSTIVSAIAAAGLVAWVWLRHRVGG